MRIHVIATGGTISSHFDGTDWGNIGGAQLVEEAGPHDVDVTVEDVAAGPSSNLSVGDMVSIARRAGQALVDGADGVVVVHGTDTIELTSFVTSLLLGTGPARRPIVFTGSMRVHSHPEPDGPQNIRDAIAVASSPLAVGHDVLVCLDGRLHAAAQVTKVNAVSLDAFSSAPFEPIGTVGPLGPVFREASPPRRAATDVAGEVPLLTCYPGIEPEEIARLAVDRRGLVLEVFGNLNVPMGLWEPVHRAWNAGVMVVLASRPFTDTSADDGLALLGAVGAGGLTAQKARLAAMAALATCAERADAVAFFQEHSLSYDALDRSTGS